MPVSPLGRSISVVDEQRRPTQELSIFSEEVARLDPIVGTGSPEGVEEARQKRFYIDSAGSPGLILYVKAQNDISGDRTKGWVLV